MNQEKFENERVRLSNFYNDLKDDLILDSNTYVEDIIQKHFFNKPVKYETSKFRRHISFYLENFDLNEEIMQNFIKYQFQLYLVAPLVRYSTILQFCGVSYKGVNFDNFVKSAQRKMKMSIFTIIGSILLSLVLIGCLFLANVSPEIHEYRYWISLSIFVVCVLFIFKSFSSFYHANNGIAAAYDLHRLDPICKKILTESEVEFDDLANACTFMHENNFRTIDGENCAENFDIMSRLLKIIRVGDNNDTSTRELKKPFETILAGQASNNFKELLSKET